MKKKTALIKAQLRLLKPILTNPESIKATRRLQDEAGKIMACRKVRITKCGFESFDACIASPRRAPQSSAILYLHGGGYTAGTLAYARGFGSILAHKTGYDTLCAGYRLAPEHPFPAALDDALEAYRFMLGKYKKILLCGESAGGGLCYALCARLKEQKLPLPAGIAAISPWTDLTQSGSSYEYNRDKDPILDRGNLRFSALSYAGGESLSNPLISPVFADLTELPDSLIFAGGDEMLLSDSEKLYFRLRECGCGAELKIAPEMWHAYILYGVYEAKGDLARLKIFADERLKNA